jgi:hypothetical protein
VHGGAEARYGGAERGSGARVWGSCRVGDEVQGVRGSQIKAGPGISACGPDARARRRFRAAGARGRKGEGGGPRRRRVGPGRQRVMWSGAADRKRGRPMGSERGGRCGSGGGSARRGKEAGCEGEKEKWVGDWLTSLFLSPFLLFFFKLTQFYLNSNEI